MKRVGQHLEALDRGRFANGVEVKVKEITRTLQTRASMRTMVEICWRKLRRSSLSGSKQTQKWRR